MEENDSVVSSKKLGEFVTPNNRPLFYALDIPAKFLQHHPSTWKSLDYRRGQNRVTSLKVVSDVAKQGISFIQSFSAVISNQEQQKQYFMQVVEKHRRDLPEQISRRSLATHSTSNAEMNTAAKQKITDTYSVCKVLCYAYCLQCCFDCFYNDSTLVHYVSESRLLIFIIYTNFGLVEQVVNIT